MSIWYSKVHINLKCFQNDIIIVGLCYHIYTLTPYLKFECVNEVLPQLEIRKIMTLVVYTCMHDIITPKWISSGTSCK